MALCKTGHDSGERFSLGEGAIAKIPIFLNVTKSLSFKLRLRKFSIPVINKMNDKDIML